MFRYAVTGLVLIMAILVAVAVNAASKSGSVNAPTSKAKKDPHSSSVGMPMLVRVEKVTGTSFTATFLDLDETKPLVNNLVIAPYDKRHYKAYADLKQYGSVKFTVNDKGRDTSQLKKVSLNQLKSGQVVGVMVLYPALKAMMKANGKNLEVTAVITTDSAYTAWRISRLK